MGRRASDEAPDKPLRLAHCGSSVASAMLRRSAPAAHARFSGGVPVAMCAEGLDLGGHVAMQGLITDVFGPLTARDSQLKGLLLAGLALLVALIAGWLLGRLARALFILLFSRRIEELSRQLGYKQLETSLRLRVSLATLVGWAVQAGVIFLAVLLLGTIYYSLGVESWLGQGGGDLPPLPIGLSQLSLGLGLGPPPSDVTFHPRGGANSA